MMVGDDQSGCRTPAVDVADAILGVAPTIGGGGKSGTFHFSAAGRTSRCGFAKEIFARAEEITKQPPPAVRPIAAAGEFRFKLFVCPPRNSLPRRRIYMVRWGSLELRSRRLFTGHRSV